LLERDDNFPPWEELCAEVAKLDAILHASTAAQEASETGQRSERVGRRQGHGAP
jgi:uncharacterized protein (UPF0276 family)